MRDKVMRKAKVAHRKISDRRRAALKGAGPAIALRAGARYWPWQGAKAIARPTRSRPCRDLNEMECAARSEGEVQSRAAYDENPSLEPHLFTGARSIG